MAYSLYTQGSSICAMITFIPFTSFDFTKNRCITSSLNKKDVKRYLSLVVAYSLMTHRNGSGKNEDNFDNEAESDRIASRSQLFDGKNTLVLIPDLNQLREEPIITMRFSRCLLDGEILTSSQL